MVAAHAGAVPLAVARPRRCGSSRTCGRSWSPSSGSTRGTTSPGWSTPSSPRSPPSTSRRHPSATPATRSGSRGHAHPRLPRPGADVAERGTARRPRARVGPAPSTGGHRFAAATGGCSWSTASPASERPAWWPSWRAPWSRTASLVLWGRCDEGPVTPFQPFAEALGRYFQSLSADRISQMPDWQLTELSRLVAAPARVRTAARGGVRRPRERAVPLLRGGDGHAERAVGGRHRAPVVDDLHWADQPTLLLLRHVLRSIDPARLGIVGMYIDTEVPPDHRLRSMLADFRAVDAGRDGAPAGPEPGRGGGAGARLADGPPDLVPELCRLTDGNPLFLDEMLRQLRYREDEQAGERRHARAARPQPARGHPRAGGPDASPGCPRT